MASNNIKVIPVSLRRDMKRFLNFPYKLYQGNTFWVPPIRQVEKSHFKKNTNPALEFCSMQLFLALQGKNVVGRVAVIINEKENEDKGSKFARFGWLDFIDDHAVSAALLSSAEKWASDHGCTHIKGPYGFSNMDKAGMLIEGFEELSTMAVLYNHPYYPKHVDNRGYRKLVDYVEFESHVPDQVPPRVKKLSRLVAKRYQLQEYTPKTQSELKSLGRKVFQMMNHAYHHLEGFIPYTDQQIEVFVKQYISILNPNFLCLIMDRNQELAGMGVSMPSFSRALQKSNGRLFPFGFWHLRQAMKKNDRADLYLIAVRPDLQQKGVTALIFEKLVQTFINYDIKRVETNPELESNNDVQNLWKDYEIRQHKRRRCFIKSL